MLVSDDDTVVEWHDDGVLILVLVDVGLGQLLKAARKAAKAS